MTVVLAAVVAGSPAPAPGSAWLISTTAGVGEPPMAEAALALCIVAVWGGGKIALSPRLFMLQREVLDLKVEMSMVSLWDFSWATLFWRHESCRVGTTSRQSPAACVRVPK